jgi:hypothetical protein
MTIERLSPGGLRESLEVDVQTVPVRRPDSEVPFRGQPTL